MAHNNDLKEVILDPMSTLKFKELLHVSYWLVDFEQSDFNVDQPNAIGLSSVTMVFSGVILEVFPGWKSQLRSDNAYHIEVHLITANTNGEEFARVAGLVPVMADDTPLWQNALKTPLSEVEIFGIRTSPQLIRFTFGSHKIVLSIGYGGDTVLVGDGDQMLVFPDEQWKEETKTLLDDWVKL